MNKDQCTDEDGFRKSSWSSRNPNLLCVAVKIASDGSVLVRDTKDQTKATLTFTYDEWRAFIQGVKVGEFDLG